MSPQAPAATGTFPRRLLVPMMLGAVLNPVNSSIISVALIPIGRAFGAPPSQTAWLVSALYLATAVGQPLVGRLVDLYGPKRLFLAGSGLVVVAGVVGMLAPTLGVLVAARVVLGFGTCAGYPSAMTLIRRVADRRGLASPAGVLTALSVTVQTVAVVGPPLGGVLVDVGGWRATLGVNVPLGLAAVLLGWWLLPEIRGARADGVRFGRALDWAGVGLFAAALCGLMLFLMRPGWAWAPALVVAAVAGTGFAVRELRTADPFVDVRVLLGNLPLLATYLRALAASVVSYGFIYGYTQWLEDGRGLAPTTAGLVLLPTFGVGIVVSVLVGRRGWVRFGLVVGTVAQVVACGLLLTLHAGSALWVLVCATVVLGIAGLLNLSNQNALYFQARPEAMGASAGLLRTFQYLGAIAAAAATAAAYGHTASTAGLHDLAGFMLAASGVGLVVVLVDRSLVGLGPSPWSRRTNREKEMRCP